MKRWIWGGGLSAMVVLAGVVLLQPGRAVAACVALPTDKGQAAFTVTIPSTGSYRIWSRLYAPSTSANGLFMQIDQTNCNVVVGHSSAVPVAQLSWVDWLDGNPTTKFDVTLTAGNHSIIAAGLDAGVGLDEVMFLSDKSCVPTGNGANCAAGSVTVTPVPQPSTTPVVVGGGSVPTPVSGVITLTANNPDGAATTYTIDGKTITGSQLDTTKLSDGTHTIVVTSKTADGKVTTTKQTIEVQNGWQYKLVAGMKSQWPWYVGGLAMLGLAVTGGVLAWKNRLKFWGPHAPNYSKANADARPLPGAPRASAPPAGSTVQPQDPNRSV